MTNKAKKPWFKKWWVWVIIVLVLFFIIGAAGGKKDSSSDSSKKDTKSVSTQTSNTTKSTTPADKPSYGIGQEVKVGDMTYKINSKTVADQVGPSALPTKPTGKFIVLDVALKNNGNEAVTVDSSFFKLKQGAKTFEADVTGSMSANQGEDGTITNSFLAQQLNPGSTLSGKVVFDVSPEIAAATDLQVQVQTGLFGTQTGLIDLK